jgi:ElaB/YqjD/DUF883 family membrane-anchored ribosome-binding protein
MSETDHSHEEHPTKVESDIANVAAQARAEASEVGWSDVGAAERLWRKAARTETSQDFLKAISAAARANPLLALGISAGVGILFGRLMSQGLPGDPVSRPKKPPRLPW